MQNFVALRKIFLDIFWCAVLEGVSLNVYIAILPERPIHLKDCLSALLCLPAPSFFLHNISCIFSFKPHFPILIPIQVLYTLHLDYCKDLQYGPPPPLSSSSCTWQSEIYLDKWNAKQSAIAFCISILEKSLEKIISNPRKGASIVRENLKVNK